MTFPRNIRAVLAVALVGLVQVGLVADARADLRRRRRSRRTRSLMAECSAACRSSGVHRVVVADEPRHDREHVVRGERTCDLPRRAQPLLQPQHQRCRRSGKRRRGHLRLVPQQPPQAVGHAGTGRSAQHRQRSRPQRGALARRVDAVLLEQPDGARRRRGPRSLRLATEAQEPTRSGPVESPPVNLGSVVNTASNDIGPGYFDGGRRGTDLLYFTSNRPGGPGLLDIYVSERAVDGSFGVPVLVPELSSASNDARPVIRADGLEAVLQSDRLPSEGFGDMLVSTRASLAQPWGPPVNLGPVLNTRPRIGRRRCPMTPRRSTSRRPGRGRDPTTSGRARARRPRSRQPGPPGGVNPPPGGVPSVHEPDPSG